MAYKLRLSKLKTKCSYSFDCVSMKDNEPRVWNRVSNIRKQRFAILNWFLEYLSATDCVQFLVKLKAYIVEVEGTIFIKVNDFGQACGTEVNCFEKQLPATLQYTQHHHLWLRIFKQAGFLKMQRFPFNVKEFAKEHVYCTSLSQTEHRDAIANIFYESFNILLRVVMVKIQLDHRWTELEGV